MARNYPAAVVVAICELFTQPRLSHSWLAYEDNAPTRGRCVVDELADRRRRPVSGNSDVRLDWVSCGDGPEVNSQSQTRFDEVASNDSCLNHSRRCRCLYECVCDELRRDVGVRCATRPEPSRTRRKRARSAGPGSAKLIVDEGAPVSTISLLQAVQRSPSLRCWTSPAQGALARRAAGSKWYLDA